jgi:hypothetical protein
VQLRQAADVSQTDVADGDVAIVLAEADEVEAEVGCNACGDAGQVDMESAAAVGVVEREMLEC